MTNSSEPARSTMSLLEQEIARLKEELAAMMTAIAEKDAEILELMQSGHAYRRQARWYGNHHGLFPHQHQIDYDHFLLGLTDEDPLYAATKVTKEALDRASSSEPQQITVFKLG